MPGAARRAAFFAHTPAWHVRCFGVALGALALQEGGVMIVDDRVIN
jgi:hypothetical protein